jgi:hypothetical protein
MRPYLITAKLMRPSNMKRFPTPGADIDGNIILKWILWEQGFGGVDGIQYDSG